LDGGLAALVSSGSTSVTSHSHFFVADPVELRINGARILTTVFAAGVRAIQIEGVENLTLKDCVLVSSLAAAESIYANPPTDVRLYGSNMANKPKHADVPRGVLVPTPNWPR